MKYAAYTEDAIWGIGETEQEAREDGQAAMSENDLTEADFTTLMVAPIDEELVEALEEAEETGDEVLFDLIDGELCEVEPVEEEEDGQLEPIQA